MLHRACLVALLTAGCAVNVDRLGPDGSDVGEGEGEVGAGDPVAGGEGDPDGGAGGGSDLPDPSGEREPDLPDPVGEGEGEVVVDPPDPAGEGEGEGEAVVDPPDPGGEGEGEVDPDPDPDPDPQPGPALLRVTPATANLGDVVVGDSSVAASFTVASVGDQPVVALELTLDGGGFSLESDCPEDGALPPDEVCLAHVTFSPEVPGPAAAIVTAQAEGLIASAVVRGLGVGAAPAELVHVAGDGAFGDASEPVSADLTFLNRGDSPTRELLAVLDGAGFSIGDDSCSFEVVAPGASCVVSVVFGPPANGPFAGELLVWGDAPVRVALSGRGVDVAEGALAVSAELIEFGAAGLGERRVQQVVARNDGARPLELLRLRLDGDDAFELDGAGTCAAGQDLAGGAVCTVAVAFAPQAEGLARGVLHVGAAGQGDLAVTLLAEGDGFEPPRLELVDGEGALVAFGDVEEAAEQIVSVRNVGDSPTGALRMGLQGAAFNLGDVAAAEAPLCPGAILGPGQICDVPLRFEPGRNGLHEGELVILDGPRELRVTLTGRGVGHGPAHLVTDPGAIDFGAVDSGDAADALTVEIRNDGDMPAEGLRIRLIGPHAGDFELRRDGAAVPCPGDGGDLDGGGDCSVTVAFRPRAEGERIAELEVLADGVDPAITTLTGTGLGFAPADLAWRGAPDPDYGDVHEVEPRAFWVQNLGGRTSGQLSIRLTGDAEFRIDPGDDDCGGRTLPPLAECAVTVTFVTADNGEYNAQLEVSDRDQSETIELAAQSVGWLPADLQADPEALQFGDLGDLDRSDELTATITNEGELPVADIEVVLVDDAGVFEIVDDNLDPPACLDGDDLLGGQSCTITGVLVPPDGDAIGSWQGTVTVGRGDHTVEVTLSGRRGVATDCKEIIDGDPDAEDGVYTIDPDADGGNEPFDAYCVMSVAGGGWTTIGYLKAMGQWSWNVYTDVGDLGDVNGGFALGSTLRDVSFPVREKVIIYRRLIEQGNDLGTHWMLDARSNGQPINYGAIHSTNNGWTYTDSRGAGPVDAGNVCSHNCNSFAGAGMFHDSSNIGYHGTQSGNYGCRDGNNICWRTHGQGCNVGAGRCSYLTAHNEGVIYGVR